ncbi:hypothetical protein C0J52_02090 [Blattella germanica]|nr:hypothetical protein C0J52_02090 [Blattella germanica]
MGYISVKLLDERIMESKQKIEENIQKLYSPIESYRQELVEKFSPLYDVGLKLEMEVFLSSEVKKFSESCEKIKYIKVFYYRIMEITSNKLFNIVRVNQIDIIKNMMLLYSDYSGRILNQMLDRHQERSRRICERFERLSITSLTLPENTEELMRMGKYMERATSAFMDKMKVEIRNVIKEFTQLTELTVFAEDHIHLNTEAVLWLHNIKPIFHQNSLVCSK